MAEIEYNIAGYNGEHPDPVSGMTHLGNGYRAYNSMLIRFTTPDSLSPFGTGGINAYAYCAGDPVNQADPSGHMSVGQWIGMAVGLVAGIALSIMTDGAAIPAVASLMTAVTGDAAIGAGAELVAEAADGKRINWGQVGAAAGISAAATLGGFALGRISKLMAPRLRQFGELMHIPRVRITWRVLLSRKKRISRPMQLRIYNDASPRFENRHRARLENEVLSVKYATDSRGARTTTIHNLYELKQHVYFHNNNYHKFVLSENNKLALSSVRDKREFNLISHPALAYLEHLEEPVKTAGTIRASEQGVFEISNLSGHYRPTQESLKHMEALLATWGVIPKLV